ncbi:MAG: hypothetical protein IPM53_11200 [Anaerolineaceae bacterium]|nr:hypothetical protein [Anaerolineaceae bacterium]
MAVFAPVNRLAWMHIFTIAVGFALAGVGVGWLGWRRANSHTAVALISLIVPLTSFLLVVNALPDITGYLIWDDEVMGYGTAVLLWLVLIVVLGTVGTAVASPNGQSIWRKLNWRVVILALMLVSYFGPWGYDLLHVPSEFGCSWPTFRVAEDFCGYPIPGFLAIVTSPSILWLTLQELSGGADGSLLAARAGVLFSWLTLLPILAALFRRAPNTQPLVPIKIWSLALIGSVGFLLWYSSGRSVLLPIQAWGIWSMVLWFFGISWG